MTCFDYTFDKVQSKSLAHIEQQNLGYVITLSRLRWKQYITEKTNQFDKWEVEMWSHSVADNIINDYIKRLSILESYPGGDSSSISETERFHPWRVLSILEGFSRPRITVKRTWYVSGIFLQHWGICYLVFIIFHWHYTCLSTTVKLLIFCQ